MNEILQHSWVNNVVYLRRIHAPSIRSRCNVDGINEEEEDEEDEDEEEEEEDDVKQGSSWEDGISNGDLLKKSEKPNQVTIFNSKEKMGQGSMRDAIPANCDHHTKQ